MVLAPTELDPPTPSKMSTSVTVVGKKETQQEVQQLQNQVTKYKDIIRHQEQPIQVSHSSFRSVTAHLGQSQLVQDSHSSFRSVAAHSGQAQLVRVSHRSFRSLTAHLGQSQLI